MLLSETLRFKNVSNPWITKDILKLTYHTDFLHRKAVINKHIDTFNLYREIRNKVTSTIRKAKSAYYTSLVYTANNNSRLMWKTLKHVLPSKKCYLNTTEIDPEQFNHLFATVGDPLTSHLGGTDLPDVNISVTTEFEFIEINSNLLLKNY